MPDNTFYDNVVELTGSAEIAEKVVKLFDRTQARVGLTDAQQRTLNFLRSGKPLVSQRQLAKECGFDHPQKLVATLAALVVKGYLVPKELVTKEKE